LKGSTKQRLHISFRQLTLIEYRKGRTFTVDRYLHMGILVLGIYISVLE